MVVGEYKKSEIIDYIVVGMAVIGLWIVVGPKFPTNDDYGLMSILAGYKSGTPTAVPFYCEYLYAVIISGLYRITDIIPWYIIVLMTLMLINCLCLFYTIRKLVKESSLKCFDRFFSYFVFVSLIFGLYFFNLIYITYSVVPAVCGCSAILLILTIKKGDTILTNNVITGIVLGLFFFAWNIRMQSGYVVLISLIFAITYSCYEKNMKYQRVLFLIIGIIAIAMISLYVNWQAGIGNGWNDFASFYDACGKYTDYTHLTYEEAPDIYQSIGWNQELYCLVNKWFFMDKRIDYNSFSTLNQSVATHTFYGYSSRRALLAGMCSLFKVSSLWIRLLLALWVITIIVVFIFKLIMHEKKSELKDVCEALLFLLIGGVLISYLLMQGRFLDRAVYPVMFCTMIPSFFLCLKIVICSNIRNIGKEKYSNKYKNIFFSFHIFIVIAFIAFSIVGLTTSSWKKYNPKSCQTKKMLEQYVMDNDDYFYINDISLTMPGDPFTVYSSKKPTNYTFWGGTFLKSPLYYEQIKMYGFDDFSRSDLIRDNVRFISCSGPDDDLFEYMREEFPNCEVEITDKTSDFIIYRFIE